MRWFSANLMAIICLWASVAAAGNWSHWRGPTGNGETPDASPPIHWSATENLRWKVKLPGRENSSPVIWDQQVFLSTAEVVEPATNDQLPKLAFKVLCFDRKTGRVIWEKTATEDRPHQSTHPSTGYASASPCTDGERVYAHFGSRGLYCYTMGGELLWHRDFGQMQPLNSFGEGSSPTLSGEWIIVPWDHQGPSALFGINNRTGDIVWKVDRDEPTCWSTPLIVDHAGQKQIIMNGQNFARSYELETGKELWRCSGQTVRPIASPVAANGTVYIGSGFQGAFLGAFRLDGHGDIQGTSHVSWILKEDCPDMASPLLVSGRLYYHKKKTALLSCADAATGKVHYSAVRIPGLNDAQAYASPVAAGGHVYLTGSNGTTVVIKDAPQLQILATNKLDEFIGATPAPVDRELFIRGENHLYCIAED